MKLITDQIQSKLVILDIDEPIESFQLLAGMQADGLCSFRGSVTGNIQAVREYGQIRVVGKLQTPVALSCSRCLAFSESVVTSNFTIFFRKGAPQEAMEEEELQLEEQDLISATYSGDEIDLLHEIEEQIAMDIPLKPLCSNSCKGLCPVCGADQNQNDCGCKRDNFNLKFSKLKDFKVSR